MVHDLGECHKKSEVWPISQEPTADVYKQKEKGQTA